MKLFFLILLIIVLIFLSVKPMEGFDASYNRIRNTNENSDESMFSNANIALFTIVFVLFIVIAFLVVKLRNTNVSS